MVDSALDYSFSPAVAGNKITGFTGIQKKNSGKLTITSKNDFTGPINIEQGILSVDALGTTVANPLGIGAAVMTLGSASTAGALEYTGTAAGSSNRGITIAAAGGTFDLPNATGGATFNGPATGSGTLTKTGPGKLTLASASSTFTGSVNVTPSAVSFKSLGNASGGTITLGSSGQMGTFEYTGASASTGLGIVTGAVRRPVRFPSPRGSPISPSAATLAARPSTSSRTAP